MANIKHYVAYPMNMKQEGSAFKLVTIPEAGLNTGEIVSLDALDTEDGNYSVYAYSKVDATNILKNRLALVLRATQELLPDGTPNQNNRDWTTYKNVAGGDPAAVFLLDERADLQISLDAVDTTVTPAVGKYLIPVAGSTTLAVAAAIPAGVYGALEIMAMNKMPIGDSNFMKGFIDTVICRTVETPGA